MNPLERLLGERPVVLSCGAGGVGKTTVAAALGVLAASRGRRTCVLTVDPARRLADALGAGHLGNEPTPIAGDFSGELHAVALDASVTFDHLVREYASDPDQVERILTNRVYRNLGSALSGTQEYMAGEKLLELHEDGRFDLVVVDTPPSRSALDFLDAPRRLSGFLDNRVLRALLDPGRGHLRALSIGGQILLRTIARVAGSEIVEDAIAFFRAFEGMETGFRDRAGRVGELLASEGSAYLLVTTPRQEALAEAAFFASRLREAGQAIDGLVVNRVQPDFGGGEFAAGELGTAWSDLVENHRQLAAVATAERAVLGRLRAELGAVPAIPVPVLSGDVHDLEGLDDVARHLAGPGLP